MILALDVSTSCIGYALFNESGEKLMELNYIKFRAKLNIFEKLNEFKRQISFLKESDIQHIVIEEPLKKFAGKYSSASTIAILNFFNGMVSASVYEIFGVEPIYYNVNTARKTAFPEYKAGKKSGENKHKIWSLVREKEPHIVWKYGPRSAKLVDENFDMTDAYTIGLCHINIMNEQLDR
jgi:RNase H-fold protein (predicted Holliday junction resolvase)